MFIFFYITPPPLTSILFFFNDTATTEIYTLSLHDALPISTSTRWATGASASSHPSARACTRPGPPRWWRGSRSDEHTSELQSQSNLVCRLLLEKKKKKNKNWTDKNSSDAGEDNIAIRISR